MTLGPEDFVLSSVHMVCQMSEARKSSGMVDCLTRVTRGFRFSRIGRFSAIFSAVTISPKPNTHPCSVEMLAIFFMVFE